MPNRQVVRGETVLLNLWVFVIGPELSEPEGLPGIELLFTGVMRRPHSMASIVVTFEEKQTPPRFS